MCRDYTRRSRALPCPPCPFQTHTHPRFLRCALDALILEEAPDPDVYQRSIRERRARHTICRLHLMRIWAGVLLYFDASCFKTGSSNRWALTSGEYAYPPSVSALLGPTSLCGIPARPRHGAHTSPATCFSTATASPPTVPRSAHRRCCLLR